MSLPSKLLYQTKVEPAAAKSYRANIQPQNGKDGYGPNSVITINIPTRNNLCMVPTESYLKFTATITNTNATATKTLRMDSNGAHGFIRRIRLFHGSNLLEDIDNYELLAKMTFDLQAPADATYGKNSILAGTANDLVGKLSTVSFTALTDNVFGNINTNVNGLVTSINGAVVKVSQPNRGQSISLDATGIAQNATKVTQTYCINLISIIGTLCNEKYFPLFACTSAPLRAEIQLVPSLYNVFATDNASGTFTLNGVEYVMNAVELSDSGMAIIQNSLQGSPLQFAVTDYKNFVWTGSVPATSATQFAVPIPAKFSSLKSILVASRDATNGLGVQSYFPCCSCKFQLSQYFFRIGPNVLPSKYPSSSAEYFAELAKAVGSMSDINYQPAIDIDSYTLDSCAAADDAAALAKVDIINSGSFYVGLDLENYPTANRDHIFAGCNSNTEDIFYYPSFPSQTAVNIRFDAYAMFDSVLVFENNTCYVKF